MILGFVSLLLSVSESPVTKICISKSLNERLLPCKTMNNSESIVEESKCGAEVQRFMTWKWFNLFEN